MKDIPLSMCLIFACFVAIFPRYVNTADANSKLLASMDSYMRTTAHPCYDFYHYSCGKWVEATTLRSWEHSYKKYVSYYSSDRTRLSDTELESDWNKDFDEVMWRVVKRKEMTQNPKLEDYYDYESEPNEIFRKIFKYFQYGVGNVDGSGYIDAITSTDNDDWPSWEERWSPEEKLNIWHTLGKFAAVGLSGFPLTLEFKVHNSTHHYLVLDKYKGQNSDDVKKEVDDVKGRHYKRKMAKILANRMSVFMNSLEALQERHNNASSVEMTISELQQNVKDIDFVKFFSTMFGDNEIGNLRITVNNLAFFSDLAKLIESTDDAVLLLTIKRAYISTVDSQLKKEGFDGMKDVLPLALNYIYDREVYGLQRNSTDPIIENVFKALQQKFVSKIEENSNQFTPKEVDMLKEKIVSMRLNIGNMFMGADEQFYKEYFGSWSVSRYPSTDNFLDMKRHKSAVNYKLLKLKGPSPLTTAVDLPLSAPTYIEDYNMLVIPFASLRFPNVHADFHELFFFADLGSRMAEAMMHIFDFDAQGNPSYLNVTGNAKYATSMKCFEKRNIGNSIGETVPIYTGLSLAYDAYFQQPNVSEFNGTKSLSNKQLFFIKFAQFFCTKDDVKLERFPDLALNHPDFDAAFSCRKRTRHHVMEKCNLW